MALFDNYTYEEVDADTFNLAKLNNETDGTFLFISDTEENPEEDENNN